MHYRDVKVYLFFFEKSRIKNILDQLWVCLGAYSHKIRGGLTFSDSRR